jgi:hypothetical protein
LEHADAQRLLDAVRPAVARSAWNPFERWSGEVTTAIGVLASIGGIATSRLGVRYDGALDLHLSSRAVPIAQAVVDQVLAFPLTALVFVIAARRLAPTVRIVDVVGAVGLSRVPVVLGAIPLALLTSAVRIDPTKPSAALLVIALLALAVVGAQIFSLVVGFRTATGARGGALASTFVIALVVAEIVSKVIVAVVRL